MKDILRGRLAVATDGWTCTIDGEEREIPELDAIVTYRTRLAFNLFYPFDEEATHQLVAAGEGATRREVIAAVRTAYRKMWSTVRHGGFALEQLSVAGIALYEESGRLRVGAELAAPSATDDATHALLTDEDVLESVSLADSTQKMPTFSG